MADEVSPNLSTPSPLIKGPNEVTVRSDDFLRLSEEERRKILREVSRFEETVWRAGLQALEDKTQMKTNSYTEGNLKISTGSAYGRLAIRLLDTGTGKYVNFYDITGGIQGVRDAYMGEIFQDARRDMGLGPDQNMNISSTNANSANIGRLVDEAQEVLTRGNINLQPDGDVNIMMNAHNMPAIFNEELG